MDEQMKQIVAALRPLFNELRDELRSEIKDVRSEMHAEFAKADKRFDKVEAGLAEIKSVTRRTAVQVSQLVGDLADVKHDMATKMATKNDLGLIHNQLEDHDKRLSRLEARRA